MAFDNGAALSNNEIAGAKSWVSGKTPGEIADKAASMGLNSSQIGQVFGVDANTANNFVNNPSNGLTGNSAPGSVNYGFDGGGILSSSTIPALSPPTVTPTTVTQAYAPTIYSPTTTYTPDTTSAAAVNANNAFTGQTQAKQMTVDPVTGTVQGQMGGILSDNSPYIQQARSGAMATANDRGLINSSIAAGAGESAAINASMPIANADAGIYNSAATNNMTQANNFLGQVTGAASNTANTNSQIGAQVGMSNSANQLSANINNADNATKASIANLNDAATRYGYNLDANTKTFLGQLQADSAKYSADTSAESAANVAGINTAGALTRQVNASAAGLSQTYMQSIANILNNKDIPPESIPAMITNLQNSYVANMHTIGVLDVQGVDWNLSNSNAAPSTTATTDTTAPSYG